MANIIAVVGAGYGDEGKGLMTDYFSDQDTMVIRSNGGAQAGHTVVTPNGNRHVFSHFGSGTFRGAKTFLSYFFVVNPLLLRKERDKFIDDFAIIPEIYIDPNCIITTPYDMILNQERERLRGQDIHGSVGVGFGETIERRLVHSSLTIKQLAEWSLLSPNEFKYQMFKFLRKVVDEYVMTKIDINKVDPNFIKLLFSDKPMQDFMESCQYLLDSVDIMNVTEIDNQNIIFEGAQGLMLDMDYGYFPYVTRSNCGMRNISKLLPQLNHYSNDHTIEVNYVTRAYTTRHGAGPLENEVYDLPFDVVDHTNITNKYQGSLRFAPLNLDTFDSITDKDFMNYAPRHSIKTTTVTCCDQLYGDITVIKDGNELTLDSTSCVDLLDRKFDYITDGPTRSTVQ